MAFIGSAVIQQISDQIVRITGLSLGAGAAGTIGLAGHTGSTPNVVLPASFKTEHYAFLGTNVPFQACIDVDARPAEVLGDAIPIAVVKTGTTTGDFRATLSNAFGSQSPGLEIYIKFHD